MAIIADLAIKYRGGIVFGLCFVLSVTLAPFAPAQTQSARYSLQYVLPSLAPPLDCYFTIEQVRNEKGQGDLTSSTLPSETLCRTMPDLVDHLKKELPAADVVVNTDNCAIVHLQSKRLRRLKQYAMDTNVQVTYKGHLQSLPDYIGKTTMQPISRTPGVIFSGFIQYDGVTE